MDFSFSQRTLDSLTLQEILELAINKRCDTEEYTLAPFVVDGKWLDDYLVASFIQMTTTVTSKEKLDLTPAVFLLALLTRFDDSQETKECINKYCKMFALTPDLLSPLLTATALKFVFNQAQKCFSVTKIEPFSKKTNDIHSFNLSCMLFDSVIKHALINSESRGSIIKDLEKIFLNLPVIIPLMIPEEYIKDFLDKWELANENTILNYRKNWLTLQSGLTYEGSPFISSPHTNEVHYKRGNYYDFHFRPILLKQNRKFTNHDDAAILRGTITPADERKLPQTLTFEVEKQENKLFKFDNKTKALWSEPCERIKVNKTTIGTFYVYSTNIKFVNEQQYATRIQGKDVKDVFWSWYDQHPNSIQIFTWNNLCYLFRFKGQTSHKFVQQLKKCKMPNVRFFQENPPNVELQKNHITKDWVEHRMSTEEYLMWLNLLSGRSFDNVRCYPIFPFLLLDMKEEKFDPEKPEMYRDLSKNIAVINETNLETLSAQAEALSFECGHMFLHASLYSNPFCVCYYLIRQEPFATAHIKLQDGTFDLGSRIFKSIPYLAERVKTVPGYNREFIPEFFYDDECLRNSNAFNFGCGADGKEINDVEIPRWSSTCQDFVSKQHEALESDFTGENIGKWIDMIWGVEQDGDLAVEANNTFTPDIYPDTWNRNESDDKGVLASLVSLGQIPQKLFSAPHPKRSPLPAKNEKGILVLSQIESPVVGFKCCGNSVTTIRLFSVLKNGQLICLKTSGNNILVDPKKTDKRIRFPTDQSLIAFSDSSVPSFVFASPKASVPSSFAFEDNIILSATAEPHLDEISAIATSGNYVLTGSKDACIALWEGNDLKFITTLMAHERPIACCTLSTTFGVAVSVSINGNFVVSTIPQLSFIRKVSLNLPKGVEPSQVIVTHAMGYIVFTAGNIVMSFTINGRKNSERVFDSNIVNACTFQSLHYTDVIGVVTETNQIEFLSAQSLETIKVLCKPKEKITKIEFNSELRVLISAAESSLVYFFPVD